MIGDKIKHVDDDTPKISTLLSTLKLVQTTNKLDIQ